MDEGGHTKTGSERQEEAKKPEFRSSFKTWLRIVAFIVIAVFLPEQVAQAVEYDWRVIWRQPMANTFAPNYLRDLRAVDIPLTVRNILKDIAGKPINAIKLSDSLTIYLDKPLNISVTRIEEIYNWLKGKPCGTKALFDFFGLKGIQAADQDIAVMALTVDILNGTVKPEGNPKIIKNSMFALSKASEYFGQKLYPVKIDMQGQSPSGKVPVPFIAHLSSDHYVLVTRIDGDKVYYTEEHKEAFVPMEKFLKRFTGNALVTKADGLVLLTDKEAMAVMGAEDNGTTNTNIDYSFTDTFNNAWNDSKPASVPQSYNLWNSSPVVTTINPTVNTSSITQSTYIPTPVTNTTFMGEFNSGWYGQTNISVPTPTYTSYQINQPTNYNYNINTSFSYNVPTNISAPSYQPNYNIPSVTNINMPSVNYSASIPSASAQNIPSINYNLPAIDRSFSYSAYSNPSSIPPSAQPIYNAPVATSISVPSVPVSYNVDTSFTMDMPKTNIPSAPSMSL